MSWFDDAERYAHGNFPDKPSGHALVNSVQRFFPNMTPENVQDTAGDIEERWDEFNKRHPSLASSKVSFCSEVVADVRKRIELGEHTDAVRKDLLGRNLSLPQVDEIVGRAILSAADHSPLQSSGFMAALLAGLPLGHPDALNICRTEVAALRQPPEAA
jgi:hypothetical protein